MKRNYLLLAVIVLAFVFMKSCKKDAATAEVQLVSYEPFEAVEMPSVLANGMPFPLDSTVIDGWLSEPNTGPDGLQQDPRIISHAWGLWHALTEMTDVRYDGRSLRRFETWYTPQDVIYATKNNVALKDVKRSDGNLQFRNKFKFGHDNNLNTSAGDISGKVKYNPSMAQRALDKRYFDEDVIKAMIEPGKINTVEFQPSDVSLKPVYRVLTDVNKVADGKYYFNIWAGKQDGGQPDSLFSKKIIVNIDLESPMKQEVNGVMEYNVKNFIFHNMSADEAYRYNNQSKEGQEFKDTAKEGDVVILLGMHVSTRETRRWTWQSFYWTEDPDNPVFPSSARIALGRGSLNPPLDFPTNQYAVTIAYSMMSPALPYETPNGDPIDISKQEVNPVYGLNPYIEGTFTKENAFPNQADYFKDAYAVQFYKGNEDGITSNCMSCHSQAYYDGGGFPNNFLADQYVNRNAPWFEGTVQLDFAWSLFPGFEESLLPSANDDKKK